MKFLTSAVNHWKTQRLSAVLLIPLTIWLMSSFVKLSHLDYLAINHWLNNDLNQFLLSAFILISSFHAFLGLEVVIEDYFKNPKRKSIIKFSKYLLIVVVILSCYSILQINNEIINS